MAWRARTLFASDWAENGFASQVLWVGTDNRDAATAWVEVGVTFGWKGTNDWTFYTAHQTTTGVYVETKFATDPVLETGYGFKGFDHGSSEYRVEINAASLLHSYNWSPHLPRTIEFAGGLEVTSGCAPTRVNRTYVYRNRYLGQGDNVYRDSTNGDLVKYSLSSDASDILWCSQPITFRYWINSSIDTSLCS